MLIKHFSGAVDAAGLYSSWQLNFFSVGKFLVEDFSRTSKAFVRSAVGQITDSKTRCHECEQPGRTISVENDYEIILTIILPCNFKTKRNLKDKYAKLFDLYQLIFVNKKVTESQRYHVYSVCSRHFEYLMRFT